MKQEDFERHLRKKGSGFRLEPREDVWERITQELDTRPKRRLAIFWWLLPALMVVAGLAGYRQWFRPDATEKKTASILVQTITDGAKKNNLNTVKKTSEKISNEEKSKDTAPKENISAPKKHGISTSILTEKKEEITPFTEQEITISTQISGNEMISSSGQTEASASSFIIHPDSSHQSIQETDPTSSPKNISPPEHLRSSTISVSRISSDMRKNNMEPPSSKEGSLQPRSFNKIAKIRWEMAAGGGISRFHENRGISGSQPAFEYSSPGNSSGGGLNTGSTRNGPGRAPSPSLTWEAAISRYQMLHPNWEWKAGAGYQYLSAMQYTGERKDSVYNFSLGNAGEKSSDHYYVPGSSTEHTAGFHRIFVHTGMARLFYSGRNRFSAEAGIRTGMNISDRFLVRSENGRHFLPGNGSASSLFLGASLGLNFRNRKNWGAGLHWGTDFTPVYPPGQLEKIYWQYARFQLLVPIK